ncbi:MAG: succinyl-diaminopimelate desuccinylase [Proteobacteria bacterium]|nr:succinyl-diaminopimelate desuccinylase [Pseudomonadota bacterium]
MTDTLILAQQLIRRASVTPDDAGCQQILAERLEKCGFHCEHMPFGEVDNLWAVRGDQGPLLVFAGHTDVVPTGPKDLWVHPPFSAEIENNFLFGRGAADMKGGIAAMVTAVERFTEHHPQHRGQIGFLITSDEEGPARDGTVKVIETLKQRNIQIDYCVIGEPTSSARLGDVIKVGRRGSMNATLTITGTQGHIAYPQLANNAIHLAAPIINELISLEWDRGNENFPPTAFQISNLQAGTGASNVVPGHVDIMFNLRFSPEITVDEIKAKVEACCNRWQESRNFEYEINWELSGQPFETHYGELIRAVEDALKQTTGKKPELSTSGGTSDGRFIAPAGAQVIELGPLNATIHQVNECVSIKDLEMLSATYEAILVGLLA